MALFIVPIIISVTQTASGLKSVLLIISLIGFIVGYKRWKSLYGVAMIFVIIFIASRYLIEITKSKLLFGTLIEFSVLFILWIIAILIFTVIIHTNKYTTPRIVGSLPWILKKLHTPSRKVIKLINLLKPINPFLMYFLIIVTSIVCFANIYGFEQEFSSELDKYYFSTVTFFTVGYGDVSPKTDDAKIVSMIQMVYSSLINIIFIPLIVSFFYSNINNRSSD